ncbi:MAG: site-specific DNA-methyltransferase [Byssovorax sp.]
MKRPPRSRQSPAPGRPTLIWPGSDRPLPPAEPAALAQVEAHPAEGPSAPAWQNLLIQADNRRAIAALLPRFAGQVDLIYLDPPFGTGTSFSMLGGADQGEIEAYCDRWEEGLGDYLSTLHEQLSLMRALLSDRGTIFAHCDWRTSHYMRCLLDQVFGAACFKNEIVWRYRRWPTKTRAFQRMHDMIFWYGKTPGDAHRWNQLYEDLAASTLETFGTRRQVADISSGRRKPSQTEEETPGAPMSDVWEIGIIAPIARERLGYPTQKPEVLLRRVIEVASEPGDLVADFFAGSGTTLAVAEKLGRRFIGCDAGALAVHTTKKRLLAMRGKARSSAGFEIVAEARDEAARAAPFEVTIEPLGVPLGLKIVMPESEDLDYWAVDFEHDGETFRPSFSALRPGRKAPLPREAVHVYRLPGERRIAVQRVDDKGREARVILRHKAG